MKLIPRDYQLAARNSIFDFFGNNPVGNPIVCLPTGTGKSIVIADFLHEIYKHHPALRIMMLTHVKELIGQNYNKLITMWESAPVGIYSAGLRQKDYLSPIIFGGIGSVAKKPDLFGKIDLIIIDEAHLVSPNSNTQYQKFIKHLEKKNPNLRIIGLTATPWRLGQGHICDGGIFTDVCFDISGVDGFNWLIEQGYLATLIPKQTNIALDTSGVKIRGGEFVQKDLQEIVDNERVTHEALLETLEHGKDRKAWLIFSTGIKHAVNITKMLNQMGISAKVVHSGNDDHKMTTKERDANIKSFLKGEVKALVNSDVLTTGFDHPDIDLIAMLRPTQSPGLWVQMLGRGTRPVYAPGFDLSTQEGRLKAIEAGGKQNCIVLDFGGNTHRLGPINDPVLPKKKGKKKGMPAPVKTCEKCQTINHASVRHCVSCGHKFHFETKLKAVASSSELIKTKTENEKPDIKTLKVDHITYKIHKKAGKPDSLKVTYCAKYKMFHEYILFEHANVRGKFRQWWRDRSAAPFPHKTEIAFNLSKTLKTPVSIKVWINRKYPEVVGYNFKEDL